MSRRGPMLVGVGLVSEAIYLVTTVQLPWWRYGGRLGSWSRILGQGAGPFLTCLVGIGLLMVAYVWGWRILRVGPVERRIVWGFASLFAVTLFWLMPITSDLFTYLSQAHLFTDLGGNPLVDAPLDFRGDRLIRAYPALYASYPSVYGPAWALLSAPGTLGRYDVAGGLFYLKGLAVVAYLGCAWLLERILRQVRPASALEGLYLFAWNPLVLFMAVGDGHNDMVMMATVLLAMWLLLYRRWALAFGALVLSVWTKYVSVIFLPLFVLYGWRRLASRGKQRWTVLVRAGLATAGISALVFLPFCRPDWVAGVWARLIRPVNWRVGTPGLSMAALAVGGLLFAVVYAALVRRIAQEGGQFQRLADVGFVVTLLAFLLGAARSQPWYLIWSAVLAGLSPRRWAWPVVVALSALMLVVQVWVEWGAPGVNILS